MVWGGGDWDFVSQREGWGLEGCFQKMLDLVGKWW